MSASGDPGLVPLLVCVHVLAEPGADAKESANSNQVWWCMSCKNRRKPGGMSDTSALHKMSSFSKIWSMSKSLSSRKTDKTSRSIALLVEKTSSRSMWWKAAFRSMNSVALERCSWWAICPWSLTTCTPVTVCCDGRPPSWPMVLRFCSVGKSRERAQAWVIFPYTLESKIPR